MPAEPARGKKQLVAGDVIAGRFVVERTIGSGGMGDVVSARHVELGTLVAIKVIRGDVLGDADTVARFKREARALAKLTSVHAVRIYDVGETERGLPYLIMEHLVGRDLASVLSATGPLPVDEALEFMAQACDALTEAHDAGIVHRDLKPQNLFLSKKKSGENHIRVLDFGLAKPLNEASSAANLRLTAKGEVIGTAQYMAPEQITGAAVTVRTDVWAAGACLFRLLTGRHPFPADSAPAVCAAIISTPPLPIRELRPDLPPPVEAIVMRCLEKDPAKRFPDVRQLRAALEQARRTSLAPVATVAGAAAEASTDRIVPPPTVVRAAMAPPAPVARVRARSSSPAPKAAIALGCAVAVAGALAILVIAGVRRTSQVRLAPVGLIAPAMAQVPSAEPIKQVPLAAPSLRTIPTVPTMPESANAAADSHAAATPSAPPRRARPRTADAPTGRRGAQPTTPAAPTSPAAPAAAPSSGGLYDHL